MVPLPTTALRAVRGSREQRARWAAWLASGAPGASDRALDVLKATPTVSVYAAVVDHRPVVLKCWRLSTLAHRAYAALRSTRGSRQWRGSNRLARLGIRVPESLALIRGRHGNERIETLVLEQLDGLTLLEHMARPSLPVRAQHRVAEALARQCATMARGGVFNRDHKPSNLIVLAADSTHAEIAVLDAVAIRPLPTAAGGPGVPLERLLLEAIGVGATPRRTLLARFVATWVAQMHTPVAPHRRPDRALRTTRRDLWRSIARRIAEHGDPTPTDNPLSATVG